MIRGHVYEEVKSAKYLRVNMYIKLHKNNQINQVLRKANNIKAFLQMNTYQCP